MHAATYEIQHGSPAERTEVLDFTFIKMNGRIARHKPAYLVRQGMQTDRRAARPPPEAPQ